MTTEILTHEHALEQQAAALKTTRGMILALRVTDAVSFTQMAQAVKEAKTYLKGVKDFMGPIKESAHKTWKLSVEREKMLLAPGEEIIDHGERELVAWNLEQTRLAKEAAEQQDKERQRLEAEAQRLADVAQARLKAASEDAVLAAAAAAEAMGDTQTAEKLMEQPILTPTVVRAPVFLPPVQVQAPPRVEGLGFTVTWKAELTSMMDLVKAVAAGTAPISLLAFNDVTANQMARATKGTLAIPGVRFKEVSGMRTAS